MKKHVKKITSVLLVLALLITIPNITQAQASVTVIVNGTPHQFIQQPFEYGGWTFVPVREIFEPLGFTVEYYTRDGYPWVRISSTTISTSLIGRMNNGTMATHVHTIPLHLGGYPERLAHWGGIATRTLTLNIPQQQAINAPTTVAPPATTQNRVNQAPTSQGITEIHSFVSVANEHIFNGNYFRRYIPDTRNPGRSLYGLIDRSGNWVIQPIYRTLRRNWNGRLISAQDTESRWGLIDLYGNIVIPFISGVEIREIHVNENLSNSLFAIREANGFGLVDISGEIIIEPTFRRIDAVSVPSDDNINLETFIFAENSGDEANLLFDIQGTALVSLGNYVVSLGNYVARDVENGFITLRIVSQEENMRYLYGLLDTRTLNLILPVAHRSIMYVGNGVIAYRNGAVPDIPRRTMYDISHGVPYTPDMNWGAINNLGQHIMPPNYTWEEIRAISNLRTLPLAEKGFIRENFSGAFRSHWFNDSRGRLGTQEMQILCLNTGQVARARSIANGNHADIMGINDYYQLLLGNFLRYGHNRPVLVRFGNTVTPGAINRFHPSEHFCLHFYGAIQNNNDRTWGTSHIYFGERMSLLIERYLP